jgi:signal transduction histidine kinase
MGTEEIKKAKTYTNKEKQYVELLLASRGAMNSAESAFDKLQQETTKKSVAGFVHEATLLRKAINQLTNQEIKRTSRSFMPNSELKSQVTGLFSASSTLPIDIAAPNPETPILIKEDIAEIALRLDTIRSELQERLKIELDHVENWQNQSLFFFEKLEVHLVYFFILATLFSAGAFLLSGYVLRRYLGFLSEGAHEISSGKLDYRFNDTTDDLIGNVMRDFDFMAQQLQNQTQALQAINNELKEKAIELQEANKHKDRFLANMSHELRTPLNSIMGFSDLIIAKAEKLTPQKTKSYANKILTAAEHLLELISDLLEIAKVDAGVLKPEPSDFDLNSLATDVFEMLQPLADQKKLVFTLELKEKSTPISADIRLIRQALINLVNNALKYTKKGSINLIISKKTNENIIDIVDTGIGISPKDTKLIFRDFHRAEQGLTSNYEGVGLGLTLTKRIIDLHKGTITVRSKLKQGSTFTVSLPVN